MKEAAENALEVGIKHLVSEDGHVIDDEEMQKTVDAIKLRPGETLQAVAGYRIKIRHEAQSLADRITAFNRRDFRGIVNMLADMELQHVEELTCVLHVIFSKALSEPAHNESYAHLVAALQVRHPRLPLEPESQTSLSFTRVLLGICQQEFENMPALDPSSQDRARFSSSEALQQELIRRKHRMLACVSFLGHLFLRRLLALKVIGQIAHDFIGIKEGAPLPEEEAIECVLELLVVVGRTLDETVPDGVLLMNSFEARLRDLSGVHVNGQHYYSKELRSTISDLLDWRRDGWRSLQLRRT